MVSKENTFVNRLAQLNLISFYVMGLASLSAFILGYYQKFGFELIIALLNLYTYFDIIEKET